MKSCDLLLTDMVMPGMDGRAVAETIRKRRLGVEVIYMSGYTDDELSERDLKTTRHLLKKPFTATELVERVDDVLHGRGESPVAFKGRYRRYGKEGV